MMCNGDCTHKDIHSQMYTKYGDCVVTVTKARKIISRRYYGENKCLTFELECCMKDDDDVLYSYLVENKLYKINYKEDFLFSLRRNAFFIMNYIIWHISRKNLLDDSICSLITDTIIYVDIVNASRYTRLLEYHWIFCKKCSFKIFRKIILYGYVYYMYKLIPILDKHKLESYVKMYVARSTNKRVLDVFSDFGLI